MDYGRLFIDSVSSRSNIFFMGNNNNPSFRGSRTLVLSMEENQNPARKRPFFTSSSDEFIYDDDFYDDQLPEKKRRLTPEQVHMLEKSFEEENKLEPERKTELANKVGLQPRQVAVWFQNRRARSKAKQLERDYDLLKASYDLLLSNYQTLLKDNDLLKSQVHSLTEKLQAKEVNGLNPRSGPIHQDLVDKAQISAQQQLSSGSSGASVVVNEDNPQLVVDSGDSTYFDCPSQHPPYITTVRSNEDDISDDDQIQSCFSHMFTTVVANQQEEDIEGQDLGWWVWS